MPFLKYKNLMRNYCSFQILLTTAINDYIFKKTLFSFYRYQPYRIAINDYILIANFWLHLDIMNKFYFINDKAPLGLFLGS